MLSINDDPRGITRAAYGRCQVEELETTWTIGTVSSGAGRKAGELIVSNCRTFGAPGSWV